MHSCGTRQFSDTVVLTSWVFYGCIMSILALRRVLCDETSQQKAGRFSGR